MEDHSGADTHTAAQGGPHARAEGYALKELQPVESRGFFLKDVYPLERTHAEAGEKCKKEGRSI